MKKNYVIPEIVIIEINNDDIICTSGDPVDPTNSKILDQKGDFNIFG